MKAVSCICLTYGRSWLLNESVESFMRQEFDGLAELIIINDMQGQTLQLPAKAHKWPIRLFNLPTRVHLNAKFDLGVQHARYNSCCMWDDDDICLSGRVQQVYDLLKDGASYVSVPWHYFHDGKRLHLVNRGLHGGDCFRRDAYIHLGGSQGTGHNDQNFVRKVKDAGLYTVANVGPEAAQYIYRWGGITGHTSCYSTNLADCLDQFHRDVVSDRRFRTGMVEIVPQWSQDWQKSASRVAKQ